MVNLFSLIPRKIHYKQFHYQSQRRNLFDIIQQLRLDQTVVASAYTNPCFHLLGLCKNVQSLKKTHGSLIVHGFIKDLLCNTKLVSLYGHFGSVDLARNVFDTIPERDLYSWKVMIRCYFLNDSYSEVIECYELMRVSLRELENVVFSIALKACSELRCIDEGRKIHSEIVKVGDADSFVFNGLVDLYAKCGEIECAHSVFDEIYNRNVVSWTSIIVGYVQNDLPREGMVLFNRMRGEMIESNEFTMGSLVSACTKLGALHQGRWVHGYLIKSGIELNSQLATALLDMYSKCGDLKDARRVFDELFSVDLVSWTAIIVGYAQRGQPEEALKLFTDKKWVGIFPNSVTIATVISACAKLQKLRMGSSVHGVGVKLALEDDFVTNALVDMYAKCHMNGDAHYMFQTISNKNVVAWNSIISGFSLNGSAYKALELFNQMRVESILPNAVTLVSTLSASTFIGSLAIGSSLHAHALKNGLLPSSIFVGTALLTFYSKNGDANSARRIFDDMEDKNAVTWSAMIGSYGVQGDSGKSLELFGDFLKERNPTEAIFTAILSACSHAGMVDEGRRIFVSMLQDYKLMPSLKQYVCMVDLLARAGRLEEALDLIGKMPFQPDISLFGAFLHGCGLHLRFDLGEVGIRRMLNLNPNKARYYVLMCNLYALDGRWEQVAQVRELMKQVGFIKSSGCSVVEMGMKSGPPSSRVASTG